MTVRTKSGKTLISEKSAIRYMLKEQRRLLRKSGGISQDEKSERIGMATIDKKTLAPMHQSNSKERRIKPDTIHVKQFSVRK